MNTQSTYTHRRRTDWLTNNFDTLRDDLGPYAVVWLLAYSVVVVRAAVAAVHIIEGIFS